MIKDNNTPDNQCYRDHYYRTTGAHTRYVSKPTQQLTKWESDAIASQLLTELKTKYN